MDAKLSVVIPVYNSGKNLNDLYRKLVRVLKYCSKDYEIILVDDGSRDNSYQKMKELNKYDYRVKIIQLANNFGQQNAIMCGLHYAKGEFMITMDDDLQHPPEEIIKLLKKVKEGYEVVYGIPLEKRHSFYRNIGTIFTDIIFNIIFKKPNNIRVSSFRIMRKGIVEKIIKEKTAFVYISAITLKNTNNIANVMVRHELRKYGKSNYNLLKLCKLYFKLIINYSGYFRMFSKSSLPQFVIKDIKL